MVVLFQLNAQNWKLQAHVCLLMKFSVFIKQFYRHIKLHDIYIFQSVFQPIQGPGLLFSS
jgi:hypothetical protein